MSPPLVEPLKNIGGQVGNEVSSSLSTLSNSVPWEWVLALGGLLVLPIVGVFSRPFMRLGLAALNSASAIASAILVCISSWCVLLINYLTALTQLLRPNPLLLKALLVLAGVWGVMVVAAQRNYSVHSSIIAAVVALGAAAVGLLYKDRILRLLPRYSRSLKPRVVVPCVGAVLVVLYLIVSTFLMNHEDLTSCLVAGKVDKACLKRHHAEAI
jgi:hypothetical protein